MRRSKAGQAEGGGRLAEERRPDREPARHQSGVYKIVLQLSLCAVRCLTASPRGPQIKRMEMEARSFSPDKSRQLLLKVKEFKADHAALKTDAKKV